MRGYRRVGGIDGEESSQKKQDPPLQLGPEVKRNKITIPYKDFRTACNLADNFRVDSHARSYRWFFTEKRGIDIDFVRDCFKQGFISADRQILLEIISEIQLYCNNDVNVLITGESGTGKELVARCLHFLGGRKDKPFIPLNCAGIPESLLEAELFGIGKGVATGVAERDGIFANADGGTVFLDEIGEMPPYLQAKLLRVLDDDGSYFRVGEEDTKEERKVSARIIAATNQNIDKAIKEGRFRSDLYYRFHSDAFSLKPLYIRPGDLPLTIYYFIKGFNLANNTSINSRAHVPFRCSI